jgi:hypothetical protein
MDWNGTEVFTIKPPFHKQLPFNCFRTEKEFPDYFVYDVPEDKSEPTRVGTIVRHLPRQRKVAEHEEERLNNKKTKKDMTCGMSFPKNLNVHSKLLLLGALIVLVRGNVCTLK